MVIDNEEQEFFNDLTSFFKGGVSLREKMQQMIEKRIDKANISEEEKQILRQKNKIEVGEMANKVDKEMQDLRNKIQK